MSLINLKECFHILNDYRMKLNPAKCIFRVVSGEFLRYIVTQRVIEANPKHIISIIYILSPKNSREMHHLTGGVAPNVLSQVSQTSIYPSTTSSDEINDLSGTRNVKKLLDSLKGILQLHQCYPSPTKEIHFWGRNRS